MSEQAYKAQDFRSDQEVKWCPGCGNYAILSSVARALPEVAAEAGCKRHDFAFVSGIGCSSRFPYYVSTYGFHGIHGRAAAVATGVKVANPALSVWVNTGDGDSMAIGGNHFIHVVRRNVDLNIILFNNEIYGLTKGQYSPTSPLGKVTPTSPLGTVEQPFNPGELVLGARGSFFARSIDTDLELGRECLTAAAKHKGASVVEMLQNCVIFNSKAFDKLTLDKDTRAENTIMLRHGEKMIFGKDRNKGLILQDMKLKVVTIGEDGVSEEDILVHDAHQPDRAIHMMLVSMVHPEFPVALGVIRDVAGTSYDQRVSDQITEARAGRKIENMEQLLRSGSTWEV